MTRTAAACLACLALLVAACGESEEQKYEERMSEIGMTLERELKQVGLDIQTSGGLESAAEEIDRSAGRLERTAAELRDLEPPEGARHAHRRIRAAVERLATDFGRAAEAARHGERRAVLALFSDVRRSRGARLLAAARRGLEQAGYD